MSDAVRSGSSAAGGGQASGEWTVERLLTWTRDYFTRQGLESPRLCAEILLAHALGCQRLQLYTRYQTVPAPAVLDRFRAAVKEAATGKPISYLTGTKDFFSLTFEVTPAVLVPRPETEILVERTIDLVRKRVAPERGPEGPAVAILDLCTGSGCIAAALAKSLPAARLFASDASGAALEVAKRNAARHKLEDRMEFREGDLLAPWGDAQFDVIVSNPPYIGTDEAADLPANVRDFEPHAALFAGADGLAVLRRIALEAGGAVRAGGYLLLEVGYRQAGAAKGLLEAARWRDIVTFRDHLKHERVVQARKEQ